MSKITPFASLLLAATLAIAPAIADPKKGWKHDRRNHYNFDESGHDWHHHDRHHDHYRHHPHDRYGGPWQRRGADYGYGRGGDGFSARFERTLFSGARSGRLSDRELRELRERKYELDRLERRYSWDGRLNRDEREELWDRRRDLEERLEHEWSDGEKRRF